jgi:regulator of RNase E activity RraA
MEQANWEQRFATLTTPHIADGCIRAGVEVRCAPSGIQAREPGARLVGRALPTQHVGSVDVFLEAFEGAESGDVLVVDNRGRRDESCVGDLVALEAKGAGISGILIWGLNRDTVDVREIGLPVFSLGTIPTGPLHFTERPADALAVATVGDWTVTRDDVVFGDEDGALFVPRSSVDAVLGFAETIRDTERAQADRMSAGTSLREQVRFTDYLTARKADPALTFRTHLNAVGGAVEV